MSARTTIRNAVSGCASAALVVGLAINPAHADFSPSQPIELVIPAGAGGGADQIARLMSSLIEDRGTSSYPFVPVNKSGDSGAEALNYMQDDADPDHAVMVTLNSFYTTPIIMKDLQIDPMSFTPIGLMAIDTFLLWVPNTSAYGNVTDLDSYVEAVKSEGGEWQMGGTGSGQEDSILTAMIEAEFGLQTHYVPFPGGGTVAEQLVRQNLDSTVNNPAEQIDYWRAKMSRPLVQFTDERQEIFPDVPTAQELGHDLVYYMQRSVNGAPRMSAEAQKWYIEVFQGIFESPEWQAFCDDEGLDCTDWVAGQQLAEFHADNLARHRELVQEVGAEAISGE